ncbi:molybdate ABC transporter substrate-binding protein [Trinickia caryophylli]|nr:molybdate ABC transporter substrate-binding protein [Trinickia caryophylli]PMS11073.1 molybdate ABC transporter substrate-binding protein [Trinickia caryophylli]TRX14529.1 molybdate ABC transporter substrate-binding protein [Trinickia caryophylli]WQE14366.1 molybdate ABC transporter substrate-binding protein [Trinickia caryophylli]
MSIFCRPPRGLLRRAFAVAAVSLLAVTSARADELVVSAAASLTNAFKDVAAGFERQHPGTKVVLNFGASDVLMQQIVNGAPADVFASADETAMDKAAQAGVVDPSTRKDFAANSLVMIVPADSRLSLGSPRDLIATPEVKRIALADPASVPAGRYAQQALEANGKDVWDAVKAKSVLATNVRQCLDYVSRGEVEAGFVFGTDAAIAKGRVKVAATLPTRTPVTYPIALVKSGTREAQARAFEDYVLSPEGQAMLAKYGFKSPSPK